MQNPIRTTTTITTTPAHAIKTLSTRSGFPTGKRQLGHRHLNTKAIARVSILKPALLIRTMRPSTPFYYLGANHSRLV